MRRLLIALLLVLVARPAWAACNGASPTWACTADSTVAQIQVCVNGATAGDTINIGAGSATWTSQLVITKAITLIGAGVGNTVITDGITHAETPASSLILWTLAATGDHRLGQMTILGGSLAGYQDMYGMVHVQGTGSTTPNLRIDHVRFTTSVTPAIMVYDAVGVIDNCTFELTHGFGIYVLHNKWNGIGAYGDNSWAQPAGWGTNQFLFVEDCTFTTTVSPFYYGNDGWGGQRVVYRYNTYTNVLWANHGLESSGRWRSARAAEIYNNTFYATGAAMDTPSMIGSRGGGMLVHHNDLYVSGGAVVSYLVDFVHYNYERGMEQAKAWPWGPWTGNTAVTSITRSGSTATVTTATDHGIHSACRGDAHPTGTPCHARITGAASSAYNGIVAAWLIDTTHFSYTISGTPANEGTGAVVTKPYDGNTDQYGYRAADQAGAGAGNLVSDYPGDYWPSPAADLQQALDPMYLWSNRRTTNGGSSWVEADSDNGYSKDPLLIAVNRDYYVRTAKPAYTPYTYPHPLRSAPAAPTNVRIR